MTTPNRTSRIKVGEDAGTLLMFRRTVAPLFRKISKQKSERVLLDFSGVEFMSRSFADQYLSAKKASPKQIEERNVPSEVRRMLQLVSRHLSEAGSREFETTPSPTPEPYVIVP